MSQLLGRSGELLWQLNKLATGSTLFHRLQLKINHILRFNFQIILFFIDVTYFRFHLAIEFYCLSLKYADTVIRWKLNYQVSLIQVVPSGDSKFL